MASLLLIYPPFCTPASPPYSLVNLYGFLKNNLPKDYSLNLLDLNVDFHTSIFPDYQKYCQSLLTEYNRDDYLHRTHEYLQQTRSLYVDNHKRIMAQQSPDLFNEFMEKILEYSPTIVGLSIIYSSQAFYASALIRELQKKGIRVVIGGPAVNHHLREIADATLKNEIEFLEFVVGKKLSHDELNTTMISNFNIIGKNAYFVPELVLPLRTTNTCYYQQCAFCTHHGNAKYFEFPLQNIKESILVSGAKYVFLTDDMIHKQRLLEIATLLKPLNIFWMCQLRPVQELDKQTLKTLYESGLRLVIWGVESGSDRVLQLMRKGTTVKDAELVLRNSHEIGIANGAYILFGFPTETKEEFLETIHFLKRNDEAIDIVSTAVFGLQKGAPAYDHPQDYGIAEITKDHRDYLEPKVHYQPSSGLTQEEAKNMRKKFKGTLERIDKYPKTMNFFREHMLCLVATNLR